MASAPIQSDLALYSMLRTRRRRVEMPRGLDAMANRWLARLKHIRLNVRQLKAQAQAIVALESAWAERTEAQLEERLEEIRTVFARRRQTPEHVRQGFAAVREVAWRTTGERPFPVQIMGALGLYYGQIVEMATGEGKTLTGALAATVLAWRRRPVHVVTVNDYLAQRDADSRNVIYRRCGLACGAIVADAPPPARAAVYRLPVVYATAKELMADWLRDQLRLGRIADPVSTRWGDRQIWRGGRDQASLLEQVLVPGLGAAIVDEIDAILIDEAVTPLIIAQERGEDPQRDIYRRAQELARKLQPFKHFTLRGVERQADLTDPGRDMLAALISREDHAVWHAPRRAEELVSQALAAQHCYHLGEHYQILDGKVVIVDEYTGRFMADRQWQNGLHQAVEAKEDLSVTADRDTVASISFQRFFRQYPHLTGMTGTAADARGEMERTYGLPVRVIPTNRPVRRIYRPVRLFARQPEKWQEVARHIAQVHATGQPILVGTRSVAASELISGLLSERGLAYQVLNAVHHKAEAQIISTAGQRGMITVATNMAGRGTDIKLAPGIAELGGLHVILTERHTAHRIDRQLIGRCGRQGDPGLVQVFASLEDDLVVKYTPRLAAILRRWLAWRQGSARPPAGPGEASAPDPAGSPKPPRSSTAILRLFDLAQWLATRRAFQSRLLVIRHDYELDKSLPS